MKSFMEREVLSEEAEFRILGHPSDQHHLYNHRTWVGPHVVDVNMAHEGGGKYSVIATVDHQMGKGRVTDPRHAANIALKVRGAVDSFVKNQKPSAITFSPSTGLSRDAKERGWKSLHYSNFADYLAKKHGGNVSSDDEERTVNFPRGE